MGLYTEPSGNNVIKRVPSALVDEKYIMLIYRRGGHR